MESLLPESAEAFGERAYWEEFYRLRGSKPFEWYVEAKRCAAIVAKTLPGEADSPVIVNLGCGTCRWPVEFAALRETGRVWSVDSSEEAIRRASRDASERLRYEVDDAWTLSSVPPGSAALVVDKGLIDAVHPRDDETTRASMARLVRATSRVLGDGPTLIFSLLQPHVRALLAAHFADLRVEPVLTDGALLPFAITARPAPRRLRYVDEDLDDLDALWALVDRAADAFRRRPRRRQLAAVSLSLRLRGRHAADATQVARLRDRLAAFAQPDLLLSWTAPPAVAPLAFGLSDVRATALIDPATSSPDALLHAIARAFHCRDDDEDSQDGDSGEASSDGDDCGDDLPRVAMPEIVQTTFGYAAPAA